MGLFNFSSKKTPAGGNEDLSSLKRMIELLAFPQAFPDTGLSDEEHDLYLEYCKFLNTVLCGAVIKAAYFNARGLSGDDSFTNAVFNAVFGEATYFQGKYVLTGRIERNVPYGALNFERFRNKTDAFELVLIKM